ncbi:MAG TPA: DUF1295 domain-containing protein, partial [Polyangia bacterium]
YPPGAQGDTPTVGGDLHALVLGAPQRLVIGPDGDVSEAADRLAAALPGIERYWTRFSDLAEVDRDLNDDRQRPAPNRPFPWLRCSTALIAGLAIAIETVADHQLRRYLRSPHSKDGILDKGLWAICRHPNYSGEILFWWGLFLFGVAANPGWFWSVVGPLSITLLFVFVSVPWMDRRMLSHHPAWAEHMEKTSALLPRWRRREGSGSLSTS